MSLQPGRLVLLGHPLGHSSSPRIQNAALRAAGIPLEYETLDVPRSGLADTLAQLRRARAAGNVTIPYKEDVLSECDRLTVVARAVGAVNTFWTAVDGGLVGDNTDVGGFEAAIDALGVQRQGARVGLLGAGGAAAAVLHAIEGWQGARVLMYSRSMMRAEKLMTRFVASMEMRGSAEGAIEGATLVVNATPVGLRDEFLPVEIDAIPPGAAVLDLPYRDGETALVRAARARGHVAMDGAAMLVEQGALAFERWFGIAPDRAAMQAAIATGG